MRGTCIPRGAHRKLPQLLTLYSSPLSSLGCSGLKHLPQSQPSLSCSYKTIFSSSHLQSFSPCLCAKKSSVCPIAGCGCKGMALELTQSLTSSIPSHPIPSDPPSSKPTLQLGMHQKHLRAVFKHGVFLEELGSEGFAFFFFFGP